MAVFYQREKSKIGTLTGSIINWSREIPSADPEDTTTLEKLPAGYLRCDGSVYQAEVFPELAEILGVGDSSRYKKPDTQLLDNQFQLPDFGSKSINASNGSNLGDYLDTYLLDDSDRTISKSGVGLEVNSNIGTVYEIQYQGNFFLPSQELDITGEPGFSRNVGNFTEESDILATAWQPHGHFHDGKRTRIASPTSEFATFGRNSYKSKSSLCIMPWANNTFQPLCQAYASRLKAADVERLNSGDCQFLGQSDEREYYGACWSGCDFISSNECLMPKDVPTQGTFGCAEGGSQQGFAVWGGDSFTCGVDDGVEYQGDMGCKVNEPCSIGPIECNDKDGAVKVPGNYSDTQVPFDTVPDIEAFGAINNVINFVEEYGNDATHRHEILYEQQAHTYKVTTSPTFIPASEIVSTIRITVNPENKADQYIQPYLVQEFLIKY